MVSPRDAQIQPVFSRIFLAHVSAGFQVKFEFHVILANVQNSFCIIAFCSVAKPKDGDAWACVAVVDITLKEVDTKFICVSYDLGKVACAIINSGLPAYFVDKLRHRHDGISG